MGKIGGVAVARDHLGRHRLGAQAQLFGHMLLDRRVDIGKGADGAGNRAGGDLLAGGDRMSTRLKSSHSCASRMPSSACKKTHTAYGTRTDTHAPLPAVGDTTSNAYAQLVHISMYSN